MSGRPWRASEERYLRQAYARLPARIVADRLHRTAGSVTKHAYTIGLRKQRRAVVDGAFVQRMRELHAQGYSDPDIADALGCDRHCVSRQRRRAGLRSNRTHPRQRRHTARMTRDQCAEFGVKSFNELRRLVLSLQAVRNGFPADCTPAMCRILAALETGPKTTREICAVTGLPYRGRKTFQTSPPHWSHTAALQRLGHVVRIGRRRRGRRDFGEWVYAVSPSYLSTSIRMKKRVCGRANGGRDVQCAELPAARQDDLAGPGAV